MTSEETARFTAAKERIIGKNRERNGIGTLSEKTVHAVLKNYYAPDETQHEIPVEGCVADIFNGKEIIEIQKLRSDAPEAGAIPAAVSGDDRVPDPILQACFLDRRGNRRNFRRTEISIKGKSLSGI